jgi:hypothetical protein
MVSDVFKAMNFHIVAFLAWHHISGRLI